MQIVDPQPLGLESDMFVIAFFLRALADILHIALNAYMYIVIARAILSWVNPDPYNPVVRFLYNVTEPACIAFEGSPVQHRRDRFHSYYTDPCNHLSGQVYRAEPVHNGCICSAMSGL